MTALFELIQQTRALVCQGDFARVREQLGQFPALLAALPLGERRAAAQQVLSEMRDWQQIIQVHRAHLTQQWLATQQWNPYRSRSSEFAAQMELEA